MYANRLLPNAYKLSGVAFLKIYLAKYPYKVHLQVLPEYSAGESLLPSVDRESDFNLELNSENAFMLSIGSIATTAWLLNKANGHSFRTFLNGVWKFLWFLAEISLIAYLVDRFTEAKFLSNLQLNSFGYYLAGAVIILVVLVILGKLAQVDSSLSLIRKTLQVKKIKDKEIIEAMFLRFAFKEMLESILAIPLGITRFFKKD